MAGYFNPRTPCGVRLRVRTKDLDVVDISIHAPLAGCDRPARALTLRTRYFNPRTPCGVRRLQFCERAVGLKFQSTHPLRGATIRLIGVAELREISIHAPLAGCDSLPGTNNKVNGISIHAPLAGCDWKVLSG